MAIDPLMHGGGELDWIESIARLLGNGPPGGVGIGDDTAVLVTPSAAQLLFSSDVVVEAVHFDQSISSPRDIGWKAMAVNLSDVAAMGGAPVAAVVSIVAAGSIDLEELYGGLLEAAERYGCAVIGGDCSSGEKVAISIAVLGTAIPPGPVLRSGAVLGDAVFVTGPLGRSAAGLRMLRSDPSSSGANVDAHLRPCPRLAEGLAALRAGANAMMDISDGLGMDCSRLASSSAIGLALESIPIAEGASLDEAIGGGEDYELLFTAPDALAVKAAFSTAGLALPLRIGRVTSPEDGVRINGEVLPPTGYQHH